uniref:NADH dehydrogenase subunit 2 n=1 Tax=Halistemma rubrum TaxID=316183 RepID=UPI0026E43F60|nr:NADH dehydrogenase subunit 2 [Halistemma rubrum]WJJ70212.1 NADH dehydrogenase subunit 2 [Halistemma rubrum]
MKDKILIILFSFNIYYYWDSISPVFLFISNWKLFIVFLLIFLFVILNNNNEWQERFLNWIILIGSLVIIFTDNLFILYLGLELQTFPIFILISKNRLWLKSSEAGLKYFILGALSSGIFLLGCSIIFGYGYSLRITQLSMNYYYNDNFLIIPWLMIILPLFFKVGLAPLHFWIPDIYEGSNWKTIGFLSTISKLSVLYLIFQIQCVTYLLIISANISIIIGVLGALNQTKTKRLLGYSGITHIGFIMMLFSSINSQYLSLPNLYIFIYMTGLVGLIFIIIQFNLTKDSYIIELQNKQHDQFENIILIILILSLAGIPPLSGFIGKWLLFLSLLDNNYIFICIICVIFSFIGATYYLRLIKIVYFERNILYNNWKRALKIKSSLSGWYLLAPIIYLSILMIIKPSPFFFLLNSYTNF